MKFLSIILTFSLINCGLCCTGCVGLSSLTFEKLLKKFSNVIVKFDQQYPFGEQHEAYVAFADEVSNKSIGGVEYPDFLIATVGAKDYGDMENKDLAEKYGFNTKDHHSPVIKLFKDGNTENPISFGTETVTLPRLYSFVKANSNVRLLAPGCVKELDELAEKFVTDESKRGEILKESENFISKIECEEKKKLAKTYAALMKGIIEKGQDFVPQQRERMSKLLKDKLSEKKIEELNKKLNILSSFKFPEKNSKQEL